jgi:acetyl-CoA C-acetyltransferase
MTEGVYILSAKRTPIGSFMGALSSLSATTLGSIAARAAIEQASVPADAIEQVYLGNVLSAGLGQAPARQAALGAGVPADVPTTTISKVCGSGLEAVLLGARAIRAGDADVVLVGGMESMSRVPHYLGGLRAGQRMGDEKLVDGMIKDGLWDPYSDFHMGEAGELCAEKYELTRSLQDEFATESYRRALEAAERGWFDAELAAVRVPGPKGAETVVDRDEEPGRGNPEKFASLRPAFRKEGTITAANASSINDGAAALVLASERAVARLGAKPLAWFVAGAAAAQKPEWFTTAPVPAVQKALARSGHAAADVDLWEINEAFSCVTMACTRLLELDAARVNVHGGAVALGHPIGASGARILTTLVHALQTKEKRVGVAGICIGGGEAVAAVVERV